MTDYCNFCQQPLGFLRRVLGEHFCSVEHYELYSEQQARLALERLAAAVADKPNTERLPALTKLAEKARLMNSVNQAVFASPRRNVGPTAALPLPIDAEESVVATVGHKPDYPMMAPLEQAEIAPKRWEKRKNKKARVAPLETCVTGSPSCGAPPMPVEPSNSLKHGGRLTLRLPPIAGGREQMVSPPEPVESVNGLELQLPLLRVSPACPAGPDQSKPVRKKLRPRDRTEITTESVLTMVADIQPSEIAAIQWKQGENRRERTAALEICVSESPSWSVPAMPIEPSHSLQRADRLALRLSPIAGGREQVCSTPEPLESVSGLDLQLPLLRESPAYPEAAPPDRPKPVRKKRQPRKLKAEIASAEPTPPAPKEKRKQPRVVRSKRTPEIAVGKSRKQAAGATSRRSPATTTRLN